MRLKRGIAAMLAAVTVFGLAGCGGSEKETADSTENTATKKQKIFLNKQMFFVIKFHKNMNILPNIGKNGAVME